MDDQNRDFDKKHFMFPEKSRRGISVDLIKSLYIASGKSAEEIATDTCLPLQKIKDIIIDNKLPELRKAYIIEGVQKIQNVQLAQSNKLMDLENNFKRMRILQLETILEDHLAYYSRHGHFYKIHPTTGDILKNTDGIPMQIILPNVSKELSQLKESVTLSEGVRNLLHRLDEIINTRNEETIDFNDGTDISVDYKEIFGDSDGSK